MKPPEPIVQLLNDPGEPPDAALRHDQPELWMSLQNSPCEEIDERVEELAHEQLRRVEDAGRFLLKTGRHAERAAPDAEDDDVEREQESRFFERREDGLPGRVVDPRRGARDLEVRLAEPSMLRKAV